jgi:pectin methylesterase-like acyl-CoA thioesterase
VAARLQAQVPELALSVGAAAVEPPGRIARPRLTGSQAASYSYAEVLRGWDPVAEAAREGDRPDLVVEAGRPGDGRTTFPAIQQAVDAATAMGVPGEPRRVRILLRPGTYDEQVLVPASPVAITLYGEGPDPSAVRIRSRPAGGIASAVVRVRGAGFHAANLTIENSHNKDTGDRRNQTQAVALTLEDADRAHLDSVRLLGFQDTFFLSASDPRLPARAFVRRSYVEGDMDFIFGEATAYFSDTEVRSLGDRAISYTLAPSTHYLTRHGFVFEGCRFTHDGTPNALAGVFKLARQWNRGPAAVGKVAILHSTIGAHIDRERPWADWSIGTARYRPVQYDSDEHWERLRAAGIDPVRDLGYPARASPPEPFLAEYEARWESP